MAAATDALLQAGFAVRSYYDDHHALPAKLDDLVPQYLPAVPLDPFDGKPLRYEPAHGLIYSVGTSLKDTGGSPSALKTPPNNAYADPLTDYNQPTLRLTFQNLPAAPTTQTP